MVVHCSAAGCTRQVHVIPPACMPQVVMHAGKPWPFRNKLREAAEALSQMRSDGQVVDGSSESQDVFDSQLEAFVAMFGIFLGADKRVLDGTLKTCALTQDCLHLYSLRCSFHYHTTRIVLDPCLPAREAVCSLPVDTYMPKLDTVMQTARAAISWRLHRETALPSAGGSYSGVTHTQRSGHLHT